MTTYQTPAELGISFYNGSQTYSGASAPEWAKELIESKEDFEDVGVYTGGHKDCLNMVRTRENEIAFTAMLALSSYEEVWENPEWFNYEPDESYEANNPRYLYPFVRAMCPNRYDEAIALFEQDMAKYGEDFNYSGYSESGAKYIRECLAKMGDPTGMKCVYYERELGDDAYAGVMIHASGDLGSVGKVASVSTGTPGCYDIWYTDGAQTCCEGWYEDGDLSGLSETQYYSERFNELCKKIASFETPEEITEWAESVPFVSTRKEVRASSARQALSGLWG
jgi:hypothetical protein